MQRNPELLNILCSRTDQEFDEGQEGILEKAADHLRVLHLSCNLHRPGGQ
jgi:hypothetical protein